MTTLIIASFLLLLALRVALEAGLSWLNLRRALGPDLALPEPLAQRFTAEKRNRIRSYTQARLRLELVQLAFGAALLLVVLFSGLLRAWDERLAAYEATGALRFVIFLGGLALLYALAGLPLALYRTFSLEARYGFNRTTLRLWLLDRLKGLALSFALGVPLLFAGYCFMALSGRWWWLWAFAFVAGFQMLMLVLYPAVIAPWFNKFTPLPEGELRSRLHGLAQSAGFRTRGIYVVDASKRSGHSNAYFTGFFRPRIVLFDTLLSQMKVEETLAVLAHEIGHYRAWHVHRMLAWGLGSQLLGLFVLSLLLDWPPLFLAFGMAAPSLHGAVALFVLLGSTYTFPLEPALAWLSRRHEYEADRYSVRIFREPQALKSALVQLSEENLSNLDPHPWYSRYHYSHPTLLERMAAIDHAGDIT